MLLLLLLLAACCCCLLLLHAARLHALFLATRRRVLQFCLLVSWSRRYHRPKLAL